MPIKDFAQVGQCQISPAISVAILNLIEQLDDVASAQGRQRHVAERGVDQVLQGALALIIVRSLPPSRCRYCSQSHCTVSVLVIAAFAFVACLARDGSRPWCTS